MIMTDKQDAPDRTAAFEKAWADYMHSALHATVPGPEAMFNAGWLAGMKHCLSPYRYALWREWGGAGYAMFIGLNPSIADETLDDPTIRRCVAYAKSWGYGALCMVNLFAFRATDPKQMLSCADPVGPENDATMLELANGAGIRVAAWGVHGKHLRRDVAVKSIMPAMHVLKLTKDGHPSHPLYLPKCLQPIEWTRP